ncbi:hypothetical protein [Zavarzinia aquatilis]|uniref:(2Fe-2S) ferredoxin domain-containing protein n=1 Tax=Zavarzinia aquatilis TaxID=2211142 RepID=A0A317E334_9PROT|nr:hypothetical protein [Zavarzinia aquatilis]PWR21399.1 hypothetical protein DKG74_13275 [Zavarzinia aquatilis]
MAKDTGKALNTGWDDIVLVCAKCERKLKGGFGPSGKKDLSKVLARALDEQGARIGVVETLCLDVCPRGGVTALLASRPGRFSVIREGTPVEDALAALDLDEAQSG